MKNQTDKKYSFTARVALSVALFILWTVFYSSNERLGYELIDVWPHAMAALDMQSFPSYGFAHWTEFQQSLHLPHVLSYPVWHIAVLVLYRIAQACARAFTGAEFDLVPCIEVTSALVNAAFLVLTFNLLFSLLQKEFSFPWQKVCFYAVSLMFVGPLYVPAINPEYYLGQFTPNPWHNPTILAVKPLTVICFWLYYRLYDSRGDLSGTVREKLFDRRENLTFLLLSICILASAFCKPNFYQVFVPGLFLFCVFDVLRTRFKSFIFCVKTGLAVIPVCMLMFMQYTVSFTAQSNRIIFAPLRVWRLYTEHCIGSFLISVVFPFTVLLLCRKSGQRQSAPVRAMLIAGMVFASATVQFILLSMDLNYYTADFAWGVYLAMLLVFVAAIFRMEEYRKQNGRDRRYLLALSAYALHTVCGVGYFISLF